MSDSNHDYNRGYHDGRSGKEPDTPVFHERISDAVTSRKNSDSSDYWHGYNDGQEDNGSSNSGK